MVIPFIGQRTLKQPLMLSSSFIIIIGHTQKIFDMLKTKFKVETFS